jgi:WD40 repeat protein
MGRNNQTQVQSPLSGVSQAKLCLQASLILFFLFILPASNLGQSKTDGRPELVLQTGHTQGVFALAFSPDGRLLASGGEDYSVKVWELSTGHLLRTLAGHAGEINAVTFSPDGRILASASRDKSVKLWDATTGKLVRTLNKHSESVLAIAFASDGRSLASWGTDNTVKFWDIATGLGVETFSGPVHPVNVVAFSRDGRRMAWGQGIYNIIHLYEPETRESSTLTGHSDFVNAVAFSPDGQSLASASWDHTMKLWDVGTGRELRTIPAAGIANMSFSADGRWLVSGGEDKSVRLWEVATGNELRTFSGNADQVFAVAFSPDGRWVASGGLDRSVKVWEVSTGREFRTLAGYSAPINGVAISPDGHLLASGNVNQTLDLWDVTTGQKVHTLSGQSNWEVSPPAFSPEGQLLATPTADNTVKLWDPATGNELRTFSGHADQASNVHRAGVSNGAFWPAVAFSPDGRRLAFGGASTIELWEVATGGEPRTLTTHANGILSLTFSPNGRWLVSGGSNAIKVWDVQTGRLVINLTGHTGSVSAVAFSHDGRWLASASGDNSVKLWDVTEHWKVRTLNRHTDFVNAVAFSPDGHRLASGSSDRTVRVWDVETGRELHRLTAHTAAVTSVVFTHDGRWLVSGSNDSSIRIWDGVTGSERIALISILGGGGWLGVTPDGLFDGTADAMQKVAWRVGDSNELVPLDAFFTDYYHPGLLSEIISGLTPRAQVDIGTVLRVPSLRTMLAQKQAHLETREGQALVCFEQVPGVAVGSTPGETDLPAEINGFRVVPTDATCKYQEELPSEGNASDLVTRLQNWKPEVFTTPWDGKSSDTANSTLHVLTVGIGQYPVSSGFDALPYAAKSAKAVEDFFTEQKSRDKKPYAQVRVWPGLYDLTATRETIRNKLSEMAKAMGEDDVVFLYLAGHGVVAPGQEMFYFVPVDGHDQQIRDTGMNTAMIAEALRDMLARRVVLVIDACQSGGAVEALSKIGEAKARVEERRGQQEVAQRAGHEHGVGVHVIAATLPLAYAVQLRKEDQSALAVTLLEGLRQGKGSVGARELIEYLKQRLPEASERAVGYRQVPLTSSVGLDFKLAAK